MLTGSTAVRNMSTAGMERRTPRLVLGASCLMTITSTARNLQIKTRQCVTRNLWCSNVLTIQIQASRTLYAPHSNALLPTSSHLAIMPDTPTQSTVNPSSFVYAMVLPRFMVVRMICCSVIFVMCVLTRRKQGMSVMIPQSELSSGFWEGILLP
jgi:hypothetical protein